MKKTVILWGIAGSLAISAIFYLVQAAGMQSWTSPYYFSLERWYFILPLIIGFGVQIGLYKAIRIKQKMMGVVIAASGGVSTLGMVMCCMHNFIGLLPIIGLSGASIFFAANQEYVFGISILFVFGGIVYMYLKYRKLEKTVFAQDLQGEKVKKLYAIGRAVWYDFSKKIWSKITARYAERELAVFLRENLGENKSVLELGCGTALNLEKIRKMDLKFKKYTGVDFSKDMLGIAKKKFAGEPKIEFIEADITKFETDEKFDIILCTWVLSHLVAPADFVNRAQKFLNKDGRMFIVFFSKPAWYVSFWFGPAASKVFLASYVGESEIEKIKNMKSTNKYFANLVTTITI